MTALITSPSPRLMTDIDLLTNMDFSQGSVGSAPTGWTQPDPAQFDVADHATIFFDRGSGFTTKTVKSTTTSLEFLYQDTAIGTVVNNKVWGAMCAVYPVGPAQPKLSIAIYALDPSSVLQELWLTYKSSGWTIGAWNFIETLATPTDVDNSRFRLLLLDDGTAGEDVYWAYPHFGMVHDLGRKFTDYEFRQSQRVALGLGNDIHLARKMALPGMEISFGFRRGVVHEGSITESSLLDWWAGARRHKAFSFWFDRSKWTNDQDHFRDCITQRGFDLALNPGAIPLWDTDWDARCPKERRVQPIVRQ